MLASLNKIIQKAINSLYRGDLLEISNMENKFDLVVIGGGPGGYVAAIRALQYGLKVAVVEERDIGGTCLNRGCIPTKSLLHSAEVYHSAKNAALFGVHAGDVSFDYNKIAARKDEVTMQLRMGIEFLIKKNGGDILNGRGIIKDKNTIEIQNSETQTVTTDKIIIATGSRPSIPPVPGLEGKQIFDSDDVLAMTECPEKIVIIGGGVIGVEFATVFNTLGKKVIIIEMMDAILPMIDGEISAALHKSLQKKGIQIYTGAKVTTVTSGEKAVCTFEKNQEKVDIDADMVVVAVGRKPNTENIGIENIGVSMERGFISVNEKMETDVKGVYAIGDVTGKAQLAHVASAQGLVAAANAAGEQCAMDYTVVPSCIYTDPEVASVGLSEAEARSRGFSISIGKFPVNANGKSMIMGCSEGLVKIITDEETGVILGAHLMAPRATDMLTELSEAIQKKLNVNELGNVIHPHPTVSEIIMEAAHDVDGFCVHIPPKKK